LAFTKLFNKKEDTAFTSTTSLMLPCSGEIMVTGVPVISVFSSFGSASFFVESFLQDTNTATKKSK